MSENNMMLILCEYDRSFLEKSWVWLRDPYIKYFTDSAEFTKEDSETWFSSLKCRQNYVIFGVMYNGCPVGVCGLKISSDLKSAEYWGYIGVKELYGKGLGSNMMSLIELKAKEYKLKTLWLKVLSDNKRAIRLYTKCQYVKYEEKGKFIYMKKEL